MKLNKFPTRWRTISETFNETFLLSIYWRQCLKSKLLMIALPENKSALTVERQINGNQYSNANLNAWPEA